MAHTVTIYSTPSCHFCHLAKDFFTENNVTYTEHNVAEDTEKRTEMMNLTGQMGVPVIVVATQNEGGDTTAEDIVIGFNEPRVKELLHME